MPLPQGTIGPFVKDSKGNEYEWIDTVSTSHTADTEVILIVVDLKTNKLQKIPMNEVKVLERQYKA